MEETTTIVYSDAGRPRFAKREEPTPILGYVIEPPIPPALVPRRVAGEFSVDGLSGAISTASVSSVAGEDPAFLKDSLQILPFSLTEIERSRAGQGLGVWDALACASALLRASNMGTDSLTLRTDGELPSWLNGSKHTTMDVNGKDIAPELLQSIRDIKKSRFSRVIHEPIGRRSNAADFGPLRDLIKKERRLRFRTK